ncbi:bifunctional tRNA (5-methylaminomethyl-2-thiouridine)(34)-methyltransferase MnmD/FAD-dependent 5-carboxymethylaminomethyl-2-thiouridine(34) oxidoreductase MnmC [Aquincola sp. MAHUQ-54]|uniref:tRNA 5-methylaminomethyl-2-thiouridine biosynthesis bifunctional protein MnmC n=1 Tax=Aquincola agrisoli TaxID=3119538 RepID=A0AAW9Q921_9BURK
MNQLHRLEPATIRFGPDGVPEAPAFGDVYHARTGAQAQAEHVFLGGNGLPTRWRGRPRFVVLETGFGLGNNFLATWAAWRNDPQHCARLWFVSIEKHPPRREDLDRALSVSPHAPLARQLVAAWPPLAPGMNRLAFEDGAVLLHLLFDDVASGMRQLRLQADAIYLDGFAPSRNPAMWDRHVLKALGRLAAPGATAATWSIARSMRRDLVSAGFEVQLAPGLPPKPEMTVARFAPHFAAPRAVQAAPMNAAGTGVLVVGAGLAGAACARALARQGCEVTVLERHAAPAQEASGNPGGLFHGIVNPQDGLHARFNRAAALAAARCYAPLLADGRVPGRIDGLLRLVFDAGAAEAMQAVLADLALPPEYVQALDAAQARQRSGLPLGEPAWAYPQGGWLDPGALVRQWLAGPGVTPHPGTAVAGLRREGGRWLALDADGGVIAAAPQVVLCNAHDALRLLGGPAWPVQRQRGQLTRVGAGEPGLVPPALPVAGAGYTLALPDGSVLCGATAQFGDEDPAVRPADTTANLAQLARLTGTHIDAGSGRVSGRTAFRLVASDRLPVVGAVPQPDAQAEQPRHVAREPGLYVCTALGSRGITWAPLAGELLAAWITGAPMPLEAALVDALDPARFAVRRMRRPGGNGA